MKKLLLRLIIIPVIFCLVLLSGCAVEIPARTPSPSSVTVSPSGNEEPPPKPVLSIYYLDVGQADCMLISSGQDHMLIDAGNNADEKTILGFLKDKGVASLDYLILTHAHVDHIGSADAVIKKYDIATIIMPKVTATTKTFEHVLAAAKGKGYKITAPIPGKSYDFAESTFTILAPNASDYEDINHSSIVLKLAYENRAFLFTGDAGEVSEGEMLDKGYDLKADILKVGHHGSATSTSEAFLDAVSPEYAVISVGKGNDYNHPASETLKKLTDKGIKVFRTDVDGTITVETDGKKLKVSDEK